MKIKQDVKQMKQKVEVQKNEVEKIEIENP